MANDVTKDPTPKSDIVEDIYLWRRKKLAFSTLLVSTSTWILLSFYGFTTITIVSWIGIAVVSMIFLWGSLLRLLSKVEPELSGLEVSEEFVVETVRSCRMLMEEMVRWMFRVGAESEWFVFARTVLGFWILSRIGNLLDFHTCLFIGLVMGLTVPKLWEEYGDQIQKHLGSLKDKSKGAYNTTHEKILEMKNKLHHGTEEKVKKSE
ncbi:Reticulan like protein B13 [Arabidopsis thaliana]|uniref:Reticulon-like protein B13 n=1 Tax=Arabidopsis thaliana TaxID=3702 RepID=RTNLM_ARATH|nr:Reticulan like protein B13 [Arabidopsis thaliana]O64837.1 RecName: Full=Reticulon-like protein B13; Short=AtRTNLB13 [Arabidopsis thaliana]AAC17096.1 putative seed maturation protein [Arabidopsis thaliana]AAM14868.1 putative seed maturation protein [Arabidopsis thaliana]AEC07475.1 Reticulan like protein B13 [Arabidopsis thaliana]|eukprot:NP_565555.1 Reticulan like protein B13 [Arabidopsis thaliana]